MLLFLNNNRKLTIEVENGDIVKTKADAIVCSASPNLSGINGLEGAIHSAAGGELLEECRSLGTCDCGDAKITHGFNLPAKYIIHTVTPYYHAEKPKAAELLSACYHSCVKLAAANGCKSVAFPMLSTGEKRFPQEIAAHIAIEAIVSAAKEYVTDELTVRLIIQNDKMQFDERAYLYLDELIDLAFSNALDFPPESYGMQSACSILGAVAGDLAASGSGAVQSTDSISTLVSCGKVSDKTVMTMAVAEGILDGGEASHFIAAMKKWGKLYPQMAYGERFSKWLRKEDPQPYGSYANGAIMRVSPCASRMDLGFYFRTGCMPSYGAHLAKISTEISHNHPEAIMAAETLTHILFVCNLYRVEFVSDYKTRPDYPTLDSCKERIRAIMQEKGYDLVTTKSECGISCRETLIAAVNAFMDSDSFETAIQNALRVGGDYHTVTSVTGSIAQAAYGIPENIVSAVLGRLDGRMKQFCKKWWLRNVGFMSKKTAFSLRLNEDIWY